MYEKQAVLYSFEQKAFHIETLKEYCASNIKTSILQAPTQFRLIAVCDSYEIASKTVSDFREKFNW